MNVQCIYSHLREMDTWWARYLVGAPLPRDRRLCLSSMRQPSRASKRKRPPEEMPSSISLEVISVIRRGGRITKKRVIKKKDFDPRASPIIFSDDHIPSASDSQPALSTSVQGL